MLTFKQPLIASLFTSILAGGATALAIVLGPIASAQPTENCQDTGLATTCESPGHNDITAHPPMGSGAGGANTQNGVYGPAGDRPPVGGE